MLAALLLAALASPCEPVDRPPNVVFVLADDLGYGELGCFGQTRIRTPNVDRLEREGMRWTQHYAGSPVCAPSRCVLLTGKHTGHALVRANWENGGWGPDEPEGQFPLPADTATLARSLKRAGYATACIGKWGLGGPETSGHPNRQGFDLFFGHLCQRKAHNHYPTHLWRNAERVELANEWFAAHQRLDAPLASDAAYDERFAAAEYAPDRMIEEALGFIRAHRDRPFFLFYASPIPHVALQVPPDAVEAYPAEWDAGPYLGGKGYLPHPSPRRAYAAMVSRLDDEVGRIVRLVDELELTGDTLIVFTSDNGPTFAGGADSEFFESTAGLRGLKGSVWEGGLRVPLVARWPGHIAPGTTCDLPSGFQDWLPTLLEQAGLEIPSGLDGRSLAAVLSGDEFAWAERDLYWEYENQQALRRGRWKAVRPRLGEDDSALELYDLAADPFEREDVAADHPGVVAELERALRDARVPNADFPIPALDD